MFTTFSRRLRFTKRNNQNSPKILQEYLAILAAGKLGDEKQELLEHKLVNTKERGGLWKVTVKFLRSFAYLSKYLKNTQKHVLIKLMISS